MSQNLLRLLRFSEQLLQSLMAAFPADHAVRTLRQAGRRLNRDAHFLMLFQSERLDWLENAVFVNRIEGKAHDWRPVRNEGTPVGQARSTGQSDEDLRLCHHGRRVGAILPRLCRLPR